MKKLFQSLSKPWFLTLLGVLALAALIWFLGPLLGFAGSYPLEETQPRWILIGCLFGIWALIQGWKAIAARRKNRRMMEQMTAAPSPNRTPRKWPPPKRSRLCAGASGRPWRC